MIKSMADEPDYLIRLRTEPSGVPTVVRLRRALKVLKRTFGLRCVHIEHTAQESPPMAHQGDEVSKDDPEDVLK